MFFSKYKFGHELKGDTLYVSYSGKIKGKQIEEIMEKVYLLIHKYACEKILIDALNSNVHLELHEILSMAKKHPPAFKRARTAVVEKEEKELQYTLYQTISENHDVNMRFFNNMQEAQEWLASPIGK